MKTSPCSALGNSDQGLISWHVKDINSVQGTIDTVAYYVTSATIQHKSNKLPPSVDFLVAADNVIFKRANWNLTPTQKELLLWHYRFGYIVMLEIVLSKHKFEFFCLQHCVTVKEYLADSSNVWKTDCSDQQQSVIHSGVEAKHQNPVK